MINARAETVAEKPAFRQAFAKRRCLLPADGFYEWKADATKGKSKAPKQPHRIQFEGRPPFAFAGLWERWGRDENRIESVTIITCPANEGLTWLHHRMPVILSPDGFEAWLNPDQDLEALQSLLQPYDDAAGAYGPIQTYPVSTALNKATNEDVALLEPLALEGAAKEEQPRLL